MNQAMLASSGPAKLPPLLLPRLKLKIKPWRSLAAKGRAGWAASSKQGQVEEGDVGMEAVPRCTWRRARWGFSKAWVEK